MNFVCGRSMIYVDICTAKCQFGMTTLQFIGHQIGDGKISVPATRVADLNNFPRPKTKKHMRRFLGTANYYRKFVKILNF